MRISEFIAENEKQSGTNRYVSATFIIITHKDLNGNNLQELAEDLACENKILTYELKSNLVMLYRFSYPKTNYSLVLNYADKQLKLASRSKDVLEWWLRYHNSIQPSSSTIRPLMKSSMWPVSALEKLPKDTLVYRYGSSIKDPNEILEKHFYGFNKTLVSKATGEFKKPRSKQQCVIDVAKRILRAQEFYGSAYQDITLGELDELAMMRYRANPIINSKEQ